MEDGNQLLRYISVKNILYKKLLLKKGYGTEIIVEILKLV